MYVTAIGIERSEDKMLLLLHAAAEGGTDKKLRKERVWGLRLWLKKKKEIPPKLSVLLFGGVKGHEEQTFVHFKRCCILLVYICSNTYTYCIVSPQSNLVYNK
jgi:hypothetical protein